LYDYLVSTSYTNFHTCIYDYALPYPHGPIGYGNIDYTQTNCQQFGYFNAHDLFDLTLSGYGAPSPDHTYLGEDYTDYYIYLENIAYMSSPETFPGYGDWVLEAFFE